MYILNFLAVILLPYIGFLYKLAPPRTVPVYFYSEEASFLAGQFCVVVFFWAGYLRNMIPLNKLTEQRYFILLGMLLLFMCVSKIIFVLPLTWVMSMLAFGLGILSMSNGQTMAGKGLWVLVGISLFILACSTALLIGMGWFGLRPESYHYYKFLLWNTIDDTWDLLTAWL